MNNNAHSSSQDFFGLKMIPESHLPLNFYKRIGIILFYALILFVISVFSI